MSGITFIEDFQPEIQLETIEAAEALLAEKMSDRTQPRTCIVIGPGGIHKFWSSRRITGEFIKQQNSGRKGEMTIDVDSETFDATEAVLLMPLADIVDLADEDTGDSFGRQFVEWDGPFEVNGTLTQAICDFFAIEAIDDLTQDLLDAAISSAGGIVEERITITTKLSVRRLATLGINEFVENLDYSFKSNTPGVDIISTEMTDCEDV